MKNQRHRTVILLSLLFVLAALIAIPLLRRDERQSGPGNVLGAAPASQGGEVLDGDNARAFDIGSRARADVAGVEPVVAATPPDVAADAALRDLELLLARLREIDRTENPLGFCTAATDVAFRIAALARARVGSDIDSRLSDQVVDSRDTPRMRAAVVLACGLSGRPHFEPMLLGFIADPAADIALRKGALLAMSEVGTAGSVPSYAIQDWARFRNQRWPVAGLFPIDFAFAPARAARLAALARDVSSDEPVELRELAVLVLGQWLDHEAFVRDLLLSMLTSTDPAALEGPWRTALYALAHARDPAIVENLVDLASASSTQPLQGIVRMAILDALAQFGRSERALALVWSAIGDPSLSGIDRGLFLFSMSERIAAPRDDSDAARSAAFVDLASHVALADPDPAARTAALAALTPFPGDPLSSVAESVLLNDRDADVRMDAAKILQEATGDRAASTAILKRAFDAEADEPVREQIVMSVIALGDATLKDWLMHLSQDHPNGALGEIARQGLRQLATGSAR